MTKNYGHIPHLLGSRLGQHDHYITEGQTRIATVKARDCHDRIYVQEKLDGANVGVWKIDDELIPVTRSGNPCRKSTYLHHHYFSDWVFKHYDRFNNLLSEGERVAGEWLALAHGTRYFPGRVLGWEPFVAFDIFTPANLRITYENFYNRVQGIFKMPPIVSYRRPCSIEFAKAIYPKSLYGGEHVEGFIWRVERLGKVDFLCKWVDSAYSPGCLLDELIWNWKPHD